MFIDACSFIQPITINAPNLSNSSHRFLFYLIIATSFFEAVYQSSSRQPCSLQWNRVVYILVAYCYSFILAILYHANAQHTIILSAAPLASLGSTVNLPMTPETNANAAGGPCGLV